MLKNIIIIENGAEAQCDTLEDVVKQLIDKDYYAMTGNQKLEKMKIKASANCINNKMEVINKSELINCTLDNKFIIGDEICFILSLLLTNNIIILEEKESNIFTKHLEKKHLDNNYIIVNNFARELLLKHLNNS